MANKRSAVIRSRCSRTWASRSSPRAAPRRCCAGDGIECPRWSPGRGRRGRRARRGGPDHDGKIDLIFNPSGGQGGADGDQYRRGGHLGVPMMTMVSELGAALQAITAQRQYSWSVTSLQEHEQTLRKRAAQGASRD
ncbi:hypothetical protein QJS66_03895 [Kocuria rhizophila]|nr:hypothetical protein QJS66_03895 [Kocuria rhizophila]